MMTEQPAICCAVCGEEHGTGDHNTIIEGNREPTLPPKADAEPQLKATRVRVRYDDMGRQRVDAITSGGTVIDLSNVSNSVIIIKKGEPRVELTIPLLLAHVERVEMVTYA